MLQIPLEEVTFGSGQAYRWEMVADRPATTVGPAGYNQARHFAAAETAHASAAPHAPTTFAITGTFDLPGPVDLDALQAALLHLLRRHEVLRTRCRRTAEGITGELLAPEAVQLVRSDRGRPAEVRPHLQQAVREVHPVLGPLLTLGALVRPDRTTVHFSLDHLLSDVISIPIVMADIATAYRRITRGEQLPGPPGPGYLDYSRAEIVRNQALHPTDPALADWRDFSVRNRGFFPAFPIDLGVRAGTWHRPVHATLPLLGAEAADVFEGACRRSGAGPLAGLLAAVALAQREEGGPEIYRTLVPLDRRGERHAGAVGWFINAVPVEFPVAPDDDPVRLAPLAQDALTRARNLLGVHYVRAWQLLAPELDPAHGYRPVDFLSYLDFRRLPQPDVHRPAVHLSASGSNGIFSWFHRNDSGLHVNWIHADTPQARAGLGGLAGTLARILGRAVHSSAT